MGRVQCFVSYEKNEEVTSLCILLSKMNGYLKPSDDAKAMYFLIKNEKLLIKYKEIWRTIKTI